MSYFDYLPEEIIIKIFSSCNSSDLTFFAKVCKRWENLALRPELWKNIDFFLPSHTNIEITDHLNRFTNIHRIKFTSCKTPLNLTTLTKNENIRKISLTGCYFTKNEFLKLVYGYPNVESFRLNSSGFCIKHNTVPFARAARINQYLIFLISQWKKLKSIKFEFCECGGPKNQELLVLTMAIFCNLSIEKICLKCYPGITGDCLHFLNTKCGSRIKVLELVAEKFMSNDYKLLKMFKNLVKLTLNSACLMTKSDFKELVVLESLRELRIYEIKRRSYPELFKDGGDDDKDVILTPETLGDRSVVERIYEILYEK